MIFMPLACIDLLMAPIRERKSQSRELDALKGLMSGFRTIKVAMNS